MRRWLAAALLASLALVAPGAPAQDVVMIGFGAASASTFQWIATSSTNALNTAAATGFANPFQIEATGLTQTADENASIVVSESGTISDFKAFVENDLGAGTDSATFTLVQNGSDSALSITIVGGGGTSGTDADTLSITAGDRLSMKIVTADTPAAGDEPGWRFKFTPTTANRVVQGARVIPNNDTSVRYHAPIGHQGGVGGVTSNHMVMPLAGTINNLYCNSDTDLSGAMVRTFRFMLNDSQSTQFECVLDDTHQTCSDTSGSISVAQTDTLSLQDTPAGTPTFTNVNIGCGWSFTPTTSGQYWWVAGAKSPSQSANRYFNFNEGFDGVGTGNEGTNSLAIAPAVTLKSLTALVNTAPGSGTSWLVTLRRAAGSTALNTTIADAATVNTDTEDLAISDGDVLDYEWDPTGPPLDPGTITAAVVVVNP